MKSFLQIEGQIIPFRATEHGFGREENMKQAKFVIEPAPVTSVPVKDTDERFPVNRIFCVGRNYEAHVREMGKDPDREKPFYFTKSLSAIVESGATIPYPPGTENFHYEMEMVIAIGKSGEAVSLEQAHSLIYGYACGLDMTRRDLQLVARDKGRPWDLGKDVENSAVISPIVAVAETGHPDSGRIHLAVNGEVRQDADISDLIWNVPEVIADLSKYYHLQPGDLIYTGTPAGVGAVTAGDVIDGGIEGVGKIALSIGA